MLFLDELNDAPSQTLEVHAWMPILSRSQQLRVCERIPLPLNISRIYIVK